MALAAVGLLPYAFVDRDINQALLIGALFITGLGQGAVTLPAFSATYRGLTRAQMTPATSANRILQQLGGVFGTVALALVLNAATAGHSPATAFAHTFMWPSRPRPYPPSRYLPVPRTPGNRHQQS
ncbi:hypothetical protein [Nonomuraea insulae]|uniref:MFS transporter n=1 Tax=Nonomuraea insulae TaxID=1616787 RepID=A0ABW1D9S8_9ACTN